MTPYQLPTAWQQNMALVLQPSSVPASMPTPHIPKNSWECLRVCLPHAWIIDLELGNKADLVEIGAATKKATEGRPRKETVVKNDNDLPKHNTQKEIAKAAGVSTGKSSPNSDETTTDIFTGEAKPVAPAGFLSPAIGYVGSVG